MADFIIVRALLSLAVGFVAMVLVAIVWPGAGWAIGHGGFIVVWPALTAAAFMGLLVVDLDVIGKRLKRLRRDRSA